MSYDIQKVQHELLKMIKDIDKLCIKNDIDYYLIGGSALGAIRHKGFIPWDDDVDIAMTWENYIKFLDIADKELDPEIYYLEKENTSDWPVYYSKIKKNNTIFEEVDHIPGTHNGLYIDVFTFESISNNRLIAYWQYFCSRLLTTISLSKRGYTTDNRIKKIALFFSKKFLKSKKIEKLLLYQVRKHNKKATERVGLMFGRINFNSGIFPSKYLAGGRKVEFEDYLLPVPQDYDSYLRNFFGEKYMELPPIEQRVGHNPIKIKL